MLNIKHIVLALLIVLMAACSGGSGSSDGSSPVTTVKLTITAANGEEIALEVSGFLEALVSNLLSELVDIALSVLDPSDYDASYLCQTGTATSDYIDGGGGESTIEEGDSFTVTLTDCDIDPSVNEFFANGSFQITLSEGTDISSIRFVGSYNLIDFGFGDSDGSSSIDGILLFDAELGDPIIVAFSSSSIQLVITQNSPVLEETEQYVIDSFSWSSATNQEMSLSFEGSVDSEILGGSLDFETFVTVEREADDDYPTSGDIRFSGRNDSTYRLQALPAPGSSITQTIDEDGDGTFSGIPDASPEWDELFPEFLSLD